MIIQEIIAIAGKSGLYRILATNRNSLVVETMPAGKRFSIPGTSRVSSLGDITMYTNAEDIHIKDVLDRMFAHTEGKAGINHKAGPADIRSFMDGIVPELDYKRVYNSDLKKLVQWFNVLVDNDAFPLEVEAESEDSAAAEAEGGTAEGATVKAKPKTVKPKKAKPAASKARAAKPATSKAKTGKPAAGRTKKGA
jgi:hypothetical protein